MKIKLIFDSSCGYSKEKVENDGALFVPIKVEFKGKEYSCGVDIDKLKLTSEMDKNNIAKTSSVSLGDLSKVVDENLDKVDKLVYISLSKWLSSTNEMATHLATEEKYKDKLIVIDSNFTTPFIQYYWDKLLTKSEEGDIDKLLDFIYKTHNQQGWLLLGTLDYLYAGGRIKKAQYLAGKMLKIRPVITSDNGDLSKQKVLKGKSIAKSMKLVKEKIDETIEKLQSENINNWKIIVVENISKNGTKEIKNFAIENYGQDRFGGSFELGTEIYAHTGDDIECLGIAIDIE